jgi:hypothetical protein
MKTFKIGKLNLVDLAGSERVRGHTFFHFYFIKFTVTIGAREWVYREEIGRIKEN